MFTLLGLFVKCEWEQELDQNKKINNIIFSSWSGPNEPSYRCENTLRQCAVFY